MSPSRARNNVVKAFCNVVKTFLNVANAFCNDVKTVFNVANAFCNDVKAFCNVANGFCNDVKAFCNVANAFCNVAKSSFNPIAARSRAARADKIVGPVARHEVATFLCALLKARPTPIDETVIRGRC